MPCETCNIKSVWNIVVENRFNCFLIGPFFRNTNPAVVVGHEDGVVRTYDLPSTDKPLPENTVLQCSSCLETKGGPIQTMAIHDVTRLYNKDIVVADSRGMVTLFCNGQILSRIVLSEHCIKCLQVEDHASGHVAIVTGDTEGHISAFNPYSDLWKIRLADIRHLKSVTAGPKVQSVLAVTLNNNHGQKTNYVLVSDDNKQLYLLQQGTVVLLLKTPTNITAMCSGRFIDSEDIETEDGATNPAHATQVILGSQTGAMYILSNFQVYTDEYANIQLPITHLCTLSAADTQSTDTVLCAGNFNAVVVVREGQEQARHKTSAWVNSMVVSDIDKDGVPEVVIGCLDNHIQGLKIGFS